MADRENYLIESAIVWLQQALPSSWKVARSTTTYLAAERAPRVPDAAIEIEGSGMRVTIITEVRETFAPRDVERMFSGLSIVRSLRAVGPNLPILVVAAWLSPRSRELLEQEEINYLDLTGNAYLKIDGPQIYIRATGAAKAPRSSSPAGDVQLRGPRAGRVLRLLLDVRPPYGVRAIAETTGVALSYVSRLLESLNRDALVTRGPSGRIEDVDTTLLLRRWAESYDVFKTNLTTSFVAPRGANRAVEILRRQMPPRSAITGSWAAIRVGAAAVAAPTLLVIYTDNPIDVAQSADLLPASQGANVVLLRPYDPVVFDRVVEDDGATFVAPSQAAVDCLSGNGRMPAEGEALMTWMDANEDSWRVPSIDEVAPNRK